MITGAQASGIRRKASVTPSAKGRLRPFAEGPVKSSTKAEIIKL
jgi:hypothetical protein